MKCAKCNSEPNGKSFTEGGICYVYCQLCTDILESYRQITHQSFLTPDQRLSQIERNIREAKKNRALGKSLWQNRIDELQSS